MTVRIRPAVAGLPRYVPGRPASGGLARVYKLSSNENPYPPLPGVLEVAARACERMNLYPDLAGADLTAVLADGLGVQPTQIALGAGSVAALYALLQCVAETGDEVVYAWRSFEAYPIAIELTGARAVPVPLGPGARHDLGAMLAAVTPSTRAVLLCSPNNPTGPALRHDEVVELIAAIGDDVLVVIDEAYVEFVTDPEAVRALELRAAHSNVAVLRTFSKAYGLAGLRIGFAVGDADLAGAVRSASLPFGVSSVAQAAAIASLAAEVQLLERVEQLVTARDELADGLRGLGLRVPDAQGNFVWLPSGVRTAEHAAAFDAAGLVVRPFAPDGIRITVGEQAANERVLSVAATLTR